MNGTRVRNPTPVVIGRVMSAFGFLPGSYGREITQARHGVRVNLPTADPNDIDDLVVMLSDHGYKVRRFGSTSFMVFAR